MKKLIFSLLTVLALTASAQQVQLSWTANKWRSTDLSLDISYSIPEGIYTVKASYFVECGRDFEPKQDTYVYENLSDVMALIMSTESIYDYLTVNGEEFHLIDNGDDFSIYQYNTLQGSYDNYWEFTLYALDGIILIGSRPQE